MHERVCFVPRTLERLYEIGKVVPRTPNECWEWRNGTRNQSGYGRVRVDGRQRIASQVALELLLDRPLLPHMEATHACDNPLCVNVNHLREEPHSENMRQYGERGSHVTQCKRNHYYDTVNTYWYNGRRYCRACRRIRALKWYYEHKGVIH